MGHLGLGVGGPWDEQIGKLVTSEEQCVAHDKAGHEIRRVSELVSRRDVANRIHVRIGRLQSVVDTNPAAPYLTNASIFNLTELPARLGAFVGQGFHGQMGWMARRMHWRARPDRLWLEARSVVMLADQKAVSANWVRTFGFTRSCAAGPSFWSRRSLASNLS